MASSFFLSESIESLFSVVDLSKGSDGVGGGGGSGGGGGNDDRPDGGSHEQLANMQDDTSSSSSSSTILSPPPLQPPPPSPPPPPPPPLRPPPSSFRVTTETVATTDLSLHGTLAKRGRVNTLAWKRGYYALSNGYFCELLKAPTDVSASAKTSLLPLRSLSVDPHSRASVRRALPLNDIMRCEPIAAAAPFGLRRTSTSSASVASAAPSSSATSCSFRLETVARAYVFRAEHPQEAKAWVEGFRLVVERNAGRAGARPGSLQVLIFEDNGQQPLSIFLSAGAAGAAGAAVGEGSVNVGELKNRLVERRGLLPSQQHLQTMKEPSVMLDDDGMMVDALATDAGPNRVLRLRLTASGLLRGAPCVAGPVPNDTTESLEGGASAAATSQVISPAAESTAEGTESDAAAAACGLAVLDDIEPISEGRWRFRLDWKPPVHVDALVVYHKRFPLNRNLVNLMVTGDGDTDPWWREVLTQVHVTPQPITDEAYLTLVLEGTRDILGHAADRDADMYERPLFYFCPKQSMKRYLLDPALRLGFGDEGIATSTDRTGREIWVIKRPPLVSLVEQEGQSIKVIYTYVFKNPGKATLMPVLQCCHRFRVLFQPHGHDCYAKFSIAPSLVEFIF